MSLFDELKRRRVFKVAAAYVVVAWLAVQAASIGFPAFDAPPWRDLQRPAGGKFLVRIRDHEAPRVELARHVFQVGVLRGERAVTRDIHAATVRARRP